MDSINKPEWLQKLEAESWQAELLISGVAIYGASQLPTVLDKLINWMIFSVSEMSSFPFYLVGIYLAIGVFTLNLFFIFHFCLRALWIGLIGLQSVYPNGFGSRYTYAPLFFEMLKQRFPSLTKFNDNLDQMCSVLFAVSFALCITMLGISITIFIFLLIAFIIQKIWPFWDEEMVFSVIIVAFLILSILSGILNLKFFRRYPKMVSFQFNLSMWMSRLFFNVGFKPMIYIQYTLLTNAGLKRYYLLFTFLLIPLSLMAGIWTASANIRFLMAEQYYGNQNRQDRFFPEQYANRMPMGTLIVRSQLKSDVMKVGDVLEFFVPLANRERDLLLAACAVPDTLSGDRRYVAWQQCAKQQLQFRLNEQLVAPDILQWYDHPNLGEKGLLVRILPKDTWPVGEHVLEVRRDYVPEKYRPKIERIPFLLVR